MRKINDAVTMCISGTHLCTISKTRASVSSGYPNTEKQMKARGRRPSAFIVTSCFVK